jgi:hypothetical protein
MLARDFYDFEVRFVSMMIGTDFANFNVLLFVYIFYKFTRSHSYRFS